MNEGVRILVVEDEEGIRAGICDVLAYHGYEPDPVVTGEEGLERAVAGQYGLVLLDVMLPGMNGFDVCKKLREARPDQPVIMLTAKGSEDDILTGFSAGSDDYVTKPFSVRELVARVEALLRRSGKLDTGPERFTFGRWEVEVAALRAAAGDETVDLSPRELAIMVLLHREQGRIVSRRRLLIEVWGMQNPDGIQTRTVDMHIAKLRKKIDSEGASLIETVRGAGYRFLGS